jgi:DNA-binding NarL/FixJ family response regulator
MVQLTDSSSTRSQSGPATSDPNRDRLERIRRAARLLAGGSLSPLQSRHMASEIDRLVGMLLEAHRGSQAVAVADPRLDCLSARERQVLAALAVGETVQEVAHRCNRSPKTINNQRTNVLRKLGLRNTAELTRFAIRTGLINV